MRPTGYAIPVILGILLFWAVLPRTSRVVPRRGFPNARTQIAVFKTAINMFMVDTGQFPKSLDELLAQPKSPTNWHGPYLDGKVPRDPWGHPFIYVYPGRHNPSGYDISSMGFDGQPGTDDDITNWQQ